MEVKVRERRGVFEVCVGEELYECFHLREEAELYAEVLRANLSWERVRRLVTESVEENLGACEITSLCVEFPYLCYEVFVKGKEVSGEIEIEKGMFGSEERIAKAILRELSSIFGIPFSLPSSPSAPLSGRRGGEEVVGSLW